MPFRCLSFAALLLASPATLQATEPILQDVLTQIGISRGICSVPACGDGSRALEMARRTQFLVHAFDRDWAHVKELAAKAVEQRFWDGRLVVERLTTDRLPYADNLVDLIVLDDPHGVVTEEIRRVLRPRGWVLLKSDPETRATLQQLGFQIRSVGNTWTLARKPPLAGTDDWSHWAHGPDNNPVSKDSVIRAPYMTQWFGKPYFHAMPVITTASAGRVFVATGHIAHHDREIPTLNTIVARNGYNGRVLWERHLPEGYLVHRSAFVATEDVFYLMDGDGILQLDAETGEEVGRIQIAGLEGTLMWMAKVGNTMYVLAGPHDPPAETMKVHANFRGWGWSHVDRNYSPDGKHQIRWGFGNIIAAFDLARNKVLWRHERSHIDSRAMAILGERLFYYIPGQRLACLDRRNGEPLWLNEEQDKLSLIEQEAVGLRGTPGFRTEPMLLATPVGVFIQGQKRMNVAGFSLDNGRFLWSRRKYHNNPNMLYVNGRLYISGIERNGAVQELGPKTGDSVDNLHFSKGSCTRMTGSPEGLYCRGEGLGRYDFQTGVYTAERTARPGCNDGAIAANGLLYVGPWLCDCNLAILGQMVLAPAGNYQAHDRVVSEDSLEPGASPVVDASEHPDDLDWPTYRADNHRTASSSAHIPSSAYLLWKCAPLTGHSLPTPPVAVGDRVFVAGSDGFVRCVSADDGTEHWRFATGGPVMAAPTVWKGRVFVGSGDGYVYCLDAISGTLAWRFRVAPVERRIMVYGHLSSNWPVNSGVLVYEGTAYAAAGIVFRDGTHVVALDAATGQLKWQNGAAGKPINNQYELQAASSLGTLATGNGRLWLASGNVVAPVSFDLATGEVEVIPARRIPVWNTVMAQKPEPAGRDLMVFADRIIIHGGRLLYGNEGHEVSSAQFSFRAIDDRGRLVGPAFTPTRHCVVPPAWDNDVFITPTSRYGNVVAWKTSGVISRLGETLKLMTEMDEQIPGETPEKWGEYNRVGQVFSAAERAMRSASMWPAVLDELYATAVARNAVIFTGRHRSVQDQWFVAARSKFDGKALWAVELPCEPTLGGLSIDRHGRVLVSLCDGTFVSVGE